MGGIQLIGPRPTSTPEKRKKPLDGAARGLVEAVRGSFPGAARHRLPVAAMGKLPW